MRLGEALKDVKAVKMENFADSEVGGITYDSRKVKKGDIFVAVKGETFDGRNFIPAAIHAGAAAVVSEKDFEAPSSVARIIVSSSRNALADIANAFYGYPSRKLKVIGVTGTNGKTTTVYLINSILNIAGHKTGLIGTVETLIDGVSMPSGLTTPESCDLMQLFSQMVDKGIEFAVMEVSSHAIAQRRVRDVEFDAAVYTNLSHDHLDFHGTMESYFDTKMKLFTGLGLYTKKDTAAIVNLDDDFADALIEETNAELIGFSMKKKADVRGKLLSQSVEGLKMEIEMGKEKIAVESSLPGAFNAYNILAAASVARRFGIGNEDIIKGIASLASVPGRFERVIEGQDYDVVVDFAHTPDGLEKLLDCVHTFAKGKKILVFGCTGNRDKAKRPVMGGIAAKKSDMTIITSDDPYSEDMDEIIRDVEKGFREAGSADGINYRKVPDRAKAIEIAIGTASSGDIVLIAGRGHEKVQDIKGKKIVLDDRIIAREAIRKRLNGN